MALEKIEVHLPTELSEFARKQVDGENFVCVDDVIIEALHRFIPFIETEKRQKEWLKAEIQKGIDDLERGEVVDAEAVLDEVDEILGRKTEPAT